MIVIALTSWTKRICNVCNVVKSILLNTHKPDKIFITLSIEEFPNKEKDLPDDLMSLVNTFYKIIHINWVENNTKTMKKIFPILKYLKDDDIIINMDDDMLLPNGAIESRLKEFKKYNNPITSCNNPRCHYVNTDLLMWSCGPFSIFQKKHLNNWEIFVNNEIIKTYNDDYTYTMLLWLNGYKFKPCDDYSRHTGLSQNRIPKYNDIHSSFKNKVYVDRMDMYRILEKRVHEITNKSVIESFGFFKKNGEQ